MMKDLELLDLNQYFENLRKDAMKRIRQLEIAQNEPAIYELKNCDLDGWKIDEFMDNYELDNIRLYHDYWGEKIVLDLSDCKDLDLAKSAQTELITMIKPVAKRRNSAFSI